MMGLERNIIHLTRIPMEWNLEDLSEAYKLAIKNPDHIELANKLGNILDDALLLILMDKKYRMDVISPECPYSLERAENLDYFHSMSPVGSESEEMLFKMVDETILALIPDPYDEKTVNQFRNLIYSGSESEKVIIEMSAKICREWHEKNK